jgi:hypothetical protein
MYQKVNMVAFFALLSVRQAGSIINQQDDVLKTSVWDRLHEFDQ